MDGDTIRVSMSVPMAASELATRRRASMTGRRIEAFLSNHDRVGDVSVNNQGGSIRVSFHVPPDALIGVMPRRPATPADRATVRVPRRRAHPGHPHHLPTAGGCRIGCMTGPEGPTLVERNDAKEASFLATVEQLAAQLGYSGSFVNVNTQATPVIVVLDIDEAEHERRLAQGRVHLTPKEQRLLRQFGAKSFAKADEATRKDIERRLRKAKLARVTDDGLAVVHSRVCEIRAVFSPGTPWSKVSGMWGWDFAPTWAVVSSRRRREPSCACRSQAGRSGPVGSVRGRAPASASSTRASSPRPGPCLVHGGRGVQEVAQTDRARREPGSSRGQLPPFARAASVLSVVWHPPPSSSLPLVQWRMQRCLGQAACVERGAQSGNPARQAMLCPLWSQGRALANREAQLWFDTLRFIVGVTQSVPQDEATRRELGRREQSWRSQFPKVELEVNHIVPRRGGGYEPVWNHLENLESLCHACHLV